MNPSQNRRRETQTRRQTVETAFGNSQPVPKVVPARPRFLDDIRPRQVQPVQARPKLDSEALSRLRQPSEAAASPKISQPVPAPVKAIAPPMKSQPSAAAMDGLVKAPKRSMAAVALAGAGASEPTAAAEQKKPMTQAAMPTQPAIPVRHLPPIDMGLPGEESPLRHIDSLLQHGKLATIRRWTFRGAVAMLVLVIAGGSLFVALGYWNLHKSFKGTTTAAALKSNVNPSLLKGEGDGRINILLMGRGGGNHDAPDLTDTMMLASIDPVNHTSTLISVPRDLWVDIPNQGAMKINAAFETGEFKYLGKTAPGSTNRNAIQAGFDAADQTVENVLGVTIHYNALLSFQAFRQAVDTVQGVSVNVPSDLTDPTMAWENGNNPVLAKAGANSFNGKQALNYVRSRETTSDFARAQRQRAVLVALKGKVESAGTVSNPIKLSKLMNTFGNNVQTDLSIKDANHLYSIVKAIPDSKTNSIGLADPPNNYLSSGTLAGQAIDLPAAGLFNYQSIQSYIRTQLKDPYIIKENAKILVLNGTATPGLATAKSDELKTYGYNVIANGNAPNTNWTGTTLIDLKHGKKKYTKHYLEQRFNTNAANTLPDNSIQTNGADFVIILGSDAVTPSQI